MPLPYLSQSFPLDYDFGTDNPAKVKYVLEISVPPVMIAKIAEIIKMQWLDGLSSL